MMYAMYRSDLNGAMPESSMIRKQLYITREQERILKDRAREEGLTEAEIVREALDRHLRHKSSLLIPEHRRQALEKLLAMSEEVARRHRFPKGYKFNRVELYAEREDRWSRDSETK
jgi:hypothetical protein